MAQLEELFGRYKADLDTDMEGDGDDNPERVTGCWISFDGFSASLEAANATGVLTKGDDEHEIAQSVIDDIEDWALENGY